MHGSELKTSGTPEEGRPSRVTRLVRLVLLLMLEPAKVQTGQLAEKLSVSRRTLFRDLESLRRAGIPLTYDLRHQHYRLAVDQAALRGEIVSPESLLKKLPRSRRPEAEEPPLTLNWQEAVSLVAACRAASIPPGTEWHRHFVQVETKLREYISQQFGERAGSVHANASLLLTRSNLSLETMLASVQRL